MQVKIGNELYDVVIERKKSNRGTYIRVKKDLKIHVTTNYFTSERDIKKACPGADVKKGLPITGSQAADSRANVEKWLSTNGLK